MLAVTEAAFKLSVWAYGHFFRSTFQNELCIPPEKSTLVKSEKEDESLGQISTKIKYTAAFITYTCFSQLYENS